MFCIFLIFRLSKIWISAQNLRPWGFKQVREVIPLHFVLVSSKSELGVSSYDHLSDEVNDLKRNDY